MAVFFFVASTGPNPTDAATDTAIELPTCPPGIITIEGCIGIDDGCLFVDDTNGRTIFVNLSSVSVGAGDYASLTGFFLTDQDCNACVLKITSATDLGNC